MTTPLEPELTDELLSAYIDNAVTPEERHIVEQAATDDPDVAWRLQSLQMTVHLLHELPALALPRSFILTPQQIGEPAIGSLAAQPAPIAPPPAPRRAVQPAQPGRWAWLGEGWRTFWQGGSPGLRNAMATSLVLLFVFLAAPRFMTRTESFGAVVVAPAAAPPAESARESALSPSATVVLRNSSAAATGARAADAARLAAPAAAATFEQPVSTGGEAPVATADVENTDTPPAVAKMAAPEAAVAAESDMAAEAVAAEASTEDAVVAAAAMPAAAEAAPPMPAEAAPMALGALGAGPTLDQLPAQDADPLAAARAVAPPADNAGEGQPAPEVFAPAMAAPAGATAPLPAVTGAPTQTPTAAPTATPTETPTATPTIMPAATAPIAPTAASVAIEQGVEDARVLPTAAVQPNSSPAAALPWLAIAQLVAGAGFLLFGLLWWRSRR